MLAWATSFGLGRLFAVGMLLVAALGVAWKLHTLETELAEAQRALGEAQARETQLRTGVEAAERRRREALQAASRAEAARAATRRELAALREQVRAAGGGCEAALDAVRRKVNKP